MTLPKSLTTVTTFSKALAMILFVALPLLGFFLGMQYQKGVNPQTNTREVIKPLPTKSIEPTISEGVFCAGVEGETCPEGYVCQYTDRFPDASGTCVKEITVVTKTPQPSLSCTPRPACLSADPPCNMPVSQDMCGALPPPSDD